MTQFQDLTMRRVTQFKYVARPEANNIVLNAMQPSVRFARSDVMELPPTTYVDRSVTLDPETAKAYALMVSRLRIVSNNGEAVTAVNEGILQLKLLQMACGYVYTDKKQIFALPMVNRLRALDELIAETDRKLIIFVPFVHALQGIAEHLRHKGHSVAVVYGETSRTARDTIFQNFQRKEAPRILVAHPKTMSHGLTLTAADTIIWFAPPWGLETYEQANARIVRPSQVAKTFIVHLGGTPIERLTYARLKTKGRMQGILLDLFHDQQVML
jgi:SNF2 family DNA or RNA helicase